MSVLQELVKCVSEQKPLTVLDDVPIFVFDQALIKKIRIHLINLDVDEPQESFLLSQLQDRSSMVELPCHIVEHLTEFLQGASR